MCRSTSNALPAQSCDPGLAFREQPLHAWFARFVIAHE
jgi:hypothetical protein